MVVGQQTNAWENEWVQKDVDADGLIDHLLAVYEGFCLGRDYYKTPFWVTCHDLYWRLNPSGPKDGFV
jgi:hypothetical protein